MELLTELREKRAKTLLLSVEASDVTDQIIDDLYTMVMDHAGTCQLKFVLKDHKTNTKLKMPSKSMKVNVDNEFIDKVKTLSVFDYILE
jgi:DNA polymerase-3 subunit alpha